MLCSLCCLLFNTIRSERASAFAYFAFSCFKKRVWTKDCYSFGFRSIRA